MVTLNTISLILIRKQLKLFSDSDYRKHEFISRVHTTSSHFQQCA